MRGQKGITLVALIVTIVVLLILAVVAITSITNDDILNRATQAANTYNNAAANEGAVIDYYNQYIQNYLTNYGVQ